MCDGANTQEWCTGGCVAPKSRLGWGGALATWTPVHLTSHLLPGTSCHVFPGKENALDGCTCTCTQPPVRAPEVMSEELTGPTFPGPSTHHCLSLPVASSDRLSPAAASQQFWNGSNSCAHMPSSPPAWLSSPSLLGRGGLLSLPLLPCLLRTV